MRRMYSEKELTTIINQVVGEYIEAGALDESIADAVDAYLVEHPVDITALEGQDVSLASLDATGLITGGEIVEKMSGYSFTEQTHSGLTIEDGYVGVVKNGNKITFAISAKLTKATGGGNNQEIGKFTIPSSIGEKIFKVDDYQNVAFNKLSVASSYNSFVDVYVVFKKVNNTTLSVYYYINNLVEETAYYSRYEITLLLSDNMISE